MLITNLLIIDNSIVVNEIFREENSNYLMVYLYFAAVGGGEILVLLHTIILAILPGRYAKYKKSD